MKAAILLIGFGLSVGCKDSSPLAGSGLVIGQQIVVSDFLPGCKSLERFKVYTDLTEVEVSHGEAQDCTVLDKGTHLKLMEAETVSSKTVKDMNVAEATVLSGPDKGQTFWCTVENLASVTPGANY